MRREWTPGSDVPGFARVEARVAVLISDPRQLLFINLISAERKRLPKLLV
ncbi:hypothetical protein M1O19_02870 [Dehalococcoidia bacterium]|nr:hypothetical protein [Dehalococcoidia bacterium]MCL0058800.1 hypothetical protein [Dehalococcoidia bacterium]MCL0079004.1 hypothetical protein [Dehalococcoidia bacterium]MCL0079293.1 hypothetical protein [Dehalococcoidia bacterium]MCL0089252.1 hypothetical protein [Dehalococcoidia bacterium]